MFRGRVVVMLLLILLARGSEAQTDEIQVYDATIAEPGIFNLTLHDNFTPDGRRTAAFPGGIIPDKSFNGVPEWAYGVNDWFEAGLYFPIYSISKGRGLTFDGTKLRTLFVSPHAAERTFFYGINFEYSYNEKYWEASRFTGEIRPILGWHVHSVDLIFNPILDTDYKSFRNIQFNPASRIAYNFSPKWAVGVEEYAGYGTLDHYERFNAQQHQIFGVLDWAPNKLHIEFGAGFGLTSASDGVTLKLILSRDLN